MNTVYLIYRRDNWAYDEPDELEDVYLYEDNAKSAVLDLKEHYSHLGGCDQYEFYVVEQVVK